MATGFWEELLDLNSVAYAYLHFDIIYLKVGGETQFLIP